MLSLLMHIELVTWSLILEWCSTCSHNDEFKIENWRKKLIVLACFKYLYKRWVRFWFGVGIWVWTSRRAYVRSLIFLFIFLLKNMIRERLIICYPWSWIVNTSLWLVFSFICNEQGEEYDKLKIKILWV
jgi:hypothetical protein